MRIQFELVFLVHENKGKDKRRLSLRLSHYSTREYQREKGVTSSIFFHTKIDLHFTIYAQLKIS
jgi:hypothetical protein